MISNSANGSGSSGSGSGVLSDSLNQITDLNSTTINSWLGGAANSSASNLSSTIQSLSQLASKDASEAANNVLSIFTTATQVTIRGSDFQQGFN
jgi:hypothetical protein